MERGNGINPDCLNLFLFFRVNTTFSKGKKMNNCTVDLKTVLVVLLFASCISSYGGQAVEVNYNITCGTCASNCEAHNNQISQTQTYDYTEGPTVPSQQTNFHRNDNRICKPSNHMTDVYTYSATQGTTYQRAHSWDISIGMAASVLGLNSNQTHSNSQD